MMKGDIQKDIMEALGKTGQSLADLFLVFISSGYGASQSKIQYGLDRRQILRDKDRAKRENERRIRHRYSQMIYKLKKDGLIVHSTKANKNKLILSKIGRKKLSSLNKERFPIGEYSKEKGIFMTIIIFDIPEKVRGKRAWLRSVLKNLDYRMVQQSVWLGENKVPKSLLEDLVKLKIIDYVEIFQVTKKGSL